MPYIAPILRPAFDKHLAEVAVLLDRHHPGELNYAITRLVHYWLPGSPSYADINEAIGVLECAKLELYRRVAAPYEDSKIDLNGDVT